MWTFYYSNVINTNRVIYYVSSIFFYYRCISVQSGFPQTYQRMGSQNDFYTNHSKIQRVSGWESCTAAAGHQRCLQGKFLSFDSSSPIATEHSPNTKAWQARSNCKAFITIWTLICFKNVEVCYIHFFFFFSFSDFFLIGAKTENTVGETNKIFMVLVWNIWSLLMVPHISWN